MAEGQRELDRGSAPPGDAAGAPLDRGDAAIALVLCAAAAALIFPGLGAQALSAWDEAQYGALVRGFLARPGWTMRFDGTPYYEKPPLVFWLMAGSARLFGLDEWSLRLPSALLGSGTPALVFLLGRRLAGRGAGLLAALLLLGVAQWIAWCRLAMTDVPLVAFLVLSATCLVYGERRPALTALGGAAFAAAVLSKSAAAFLWAPGLLLLFVARRGMRGLLTRQALGAALSALAVAAPWHAYEVLRNGRAFLDEYLLHNIVGRYEEPLENHVGNSWYYVRIYGYNAGAFDGYGLFAPRYVLAWIHAAGVALAVLVAAARRDRVVAALAALALIAWAGVEASSTKIGWYLTPVYPAAALAGAVALGRIVPDRARAWGPICALAIAIGLPSARYGSGAFVDDYNVLDYSPEIRSLCGTPPFEVRAATVIADPTLENATAYYLSDRVEVVSEQQLARLADRPGPWICVTYPKAADAIAAAQPEARIVTETATLRVIVRDAAGGR